MLTKSETDGVVQFYSGHQVVFNCVTKMMLHLQSELQRKVGVLFENFIMTYFESELCASVYKSTKSASCHIFNGKMKKTTLRQSVKVLHALGSRVSILEKSLCFSTLVNLLRKIEPSSPIRVCSKVCLDRE